MHSQPIITLLLPLLAIVSAAPQAVTTTSPTPLPSTTIAAKHYLQAQPLNNKTQNALVNNNTYVTPYHSGAGTNNVTLTATPEDAAKAFQIANGGYQEFDLGTTFPWGFEMTGQLGVQTGGETAIKGAGLVNIDVGTGNAGFEMRSQGEGLWWNGTGFAGWLACEIQGQTTGLQLFWANGSEGGRGEVPGGCEGVRLVPVSL